MRTKLFFQQLAVTLVILMAGTMQTRSETFDDPGGGTYTFISGLWGRYINYEEARYFKTVKAFSFANHSYYWDFEVRVVPGADYAGVAECNGEVFLTTGDNVMHKVAEWIKKENVSRIENFTTIDNTWGTARCIDDSFASTGIIRLQFFPTDQCFADSVKRIEIKYGYTQYDPAAHERLYIGDTEFKKDINATLAENEPLPKLSVEWDDNLRLRYTAENVPDWRNDSQIESLYYEGRRYYIISDVRGDLTWNSTKQELHAKNFDVLSEHDGMIDMVGYSQVRTSTTSCAAYFNPVAVYYTRVIKVNPDNDPSLSNTIARMEEEVIVDPFTRPLNLSVEFDKWHRQNIVSWTRTYTADGIKKGKKRFTRTCRLDGTWYVIRYEDGQEAASYSIISQMSGDATELNVVDTDIEYDKKYNYRVIFLPAVLEAGYKDNLASGMLADQSRLFHHFWLERQVDTRLEMPINLWQDRSYEGAVRLVWDYCVGPTGKNWEIKYCPAGETVWRTLDSSLAVDPNKSQAAFDAPGTVCDMTDYRVTTLYEGREFTSNVYTGNLPAGSFIEEVKASTGTEESTVIVKWKVKRPDISNEIFFRVLRRPIGTEEWTVLTDEVHGTASEYTYIDNRPLAGTYYEYSVQAYGAKCDEQLVMTDEKIWPGFSQARGTITGHISFGSGTAVAGVKVNLVKASADDQTDQPQYLSRRIEGEGKGLQWIPDSAAYANVLNGQKELTLQLWAKPMSNGADTQTLLVLTGALELGLKQNGSGYHLYAIDNSNGGTALREFPELVFDNHHFTHIAATYKGSQWTFFAGTDTLLATTMNAASTAWNACPRKDSLALSLGGSNHIGGQPFNGYVDDIRLWNRALSSKDIETNYTRILGGTEEGLILYWPLDEGINVKQYAFDVARQDGIYLLNHPVVGLNAVPDAFVPHLLSLYGLTDNKGNYIIKGIPFQQGGTNYELTPLLGIHEFNPITRSMFVSPTSLTANNIDFEDVSSFPMDGHIYYAGTNIPAEGIQIYVDGDLQSEDGKIVQTDADGYYQVSVPIGEHFVEAKLDGHTMVSGGRFPTEGRFNFDRAMTYDFADSTLVNFVGRVAGGVKNDTIAVGFGASKNNIGQATITLKLNNESFSFNTDASHRRTWASNTTVIRSTAQTSANSDSTKYITIQTDPQTGEFSALLPPLKYITKNIVIRSNPDIKFSALPQIDLSSVKKEMTDSLKQPTETGDSVWTYYKYNTKMVRTFFAQPEVALWQVNGNGAFGEQELKDYAVSNAETADISVWTKGSDGNVNYTYEFPVFARKKQYKFGVYGYEVYVNHDTAVADTIAMNGQVLTIANEMSNEQDVVARVIDQSLTELKEGDIYNLKHDQLRLDNEGKNVITFNTGAPNVTAPYTRRFGITFERNKRTYLGPQLNGIVLGELTSGNNFVTDGPDHVDMVLRDPPGSKGKTTWKTGTSWTKLTSTTKGGYLDEAITFDIIWGVDLKTSVGLGVAIVSGTKAKMTMVAGEKGSFSWTAKDENTYVYTNAENISTSTGSKYVGADGDVFIGKSHNYIVGTCRKLGFHREAQGIVLGLKEAVSINDSVKTDFMYSALEIEQTMIPKIIDARNSLLEYMEEDAAKAYKNTSETDVYLTWLLPDNPDYGKEGTYEWKQNIKGQTQDMVSHYNESVRLWRQRLAENEQDKIEAFKGKDYYKENRSFDGGTTYSYSERRDTTKTSTYQESLKAGIVYEYKHVFAFNGTASIGSNINIKAEAGYTRNTIVGDSLDNIKYYSEYDYELNDGNPGTDFTVDIYRSPRGWSDIFLLRGGQSYNPYEGLEHTKHYEPEKQHVISYGTEQMEQPVISISTDGEVGAKSATLTDVPAGSIALLTLHLSNQSTTNQSFNFSYNIMVQEKANQKGLEVLMDGVPANGRSVFIPAGETIKKIITVRQTDQSVLDYEGIEIWFMSQYQPIKINDKCTLNVHFKPSSSPVDLAIAEPVLNTGNKSGELEMKLSNFDRQFKNLKNVGVQYRFMGNTQWTDIHTWVTDKADSTSTSFSILPAKGDLRYAEDMSSNLSYPEGSYEFRAFTTTPYGNDLVQVYSDIVTVTKDMTRPRNLFTPSPTNGILGYGDELAIEFNEDIVPGYITDKNVIVTAKLNQQPVNHDVALTLLPFGQQARTVNPVFLNGDFSMEFWLNWHEGGTLLHQGAGEDSFALKIDDEGHVTVSIAGAQFTSHGKLEKHEWTFIAMNYKASTMSFTMLAQYGTTNLMLFENEPVTQQAVQAVNYADDNHLYLGPILADIHDLCLFNICRDVAEAGAKKYQAKDNYVYGLTNYWPMNEGHGFIATDTRHTHDFETANSWQLGNQHYALRLDSEEGVSTDITRVNTSRSESYAIELWYKPGDTTDSEEVVFETGTPTIEGDKLPPGAKLRLRYDEGHNLILDYGTKWLTVAAAEDFHDEPIWKHLALNVVRGQAASFYVNGQRTAVIAESDMPMIEGTTLTIGKGATLNSFDELRIWKATLTESRLLSNIYNALDTADVYSRGLVAYYPLDKTGTVNGVTTKVPTMENMAPRTALSDVAGDVEEPTAGSAMPVLATPPLKNAPEETRLIASPVASERKVVINLTGAGISPRDIEGTTLNVTVTDIRDLHGNTSNPIKWTAYVQRNTLKWTKDSVNILKKYGETNTFDVSIENKSGNTEYYTLYNLPQWLTLVDSDTNDQVPPLSTKVLRFRVEPLVAVGNYDVSIGLQGNNEILEPLRVVMKVSGQMPQWAVEPAQYENTMSIVGQIYINGILASNTESRVAAFIGNECRGLAAPEQVRGAAYVPMSIYGTAQQMVNGIPADLDKGLPVTFRIWDATTGVAYTNVTLTLPDGTVTDTLYFDPTKNYGTFDHPVIFTKSQYVELPLNLRPGWNWLSLGVEPASGKPSAVFKDVTSWNVQLKDQNTGTTYCNGVYWAGPLNELHANTMYKMLLSQTEHSTPLPQPLTVYGKQAILAEMPVALKEGWNWIAYTPTSTMTLDEALAAANPQQGDQVKSQTAFAYYGPYGWEGNLKALESGKGYLYQSLDNAEKTFVYPTATTASAAARSQRATDSGQCSWFTPVAPTDYPDNMSMVIMLTDGSQPIADAEVAAFIDGECRGAATCYEGLYYLLIAGEGSGQPICLQVAIAGNIQQLDPKLTYSSDGSIGTPWEPYVIDLSAQSGIAATILDGDDDADWYTLQGIKMDHKPSKPGIYIHRQKKVTVWPAKRMAQ